MELNQFTKRCFCVGCLEKQCYKRSYHARYRQHSQNINCSKRYQRNSNGSEVWRPWTETKQNKDHTQEYEWNRHGSESLAIQSVPQFAHPVKLVWPKRPFDYMYAEGEKLLRSFPIQATLEFVSDPDSDSDDDYDDEVDVDDSLLTKLPRKSSSTERQ